MANNAFSTIKKEIISLVDFKGAIFALNHVLMESIWLGNNGETVLENCLASTSNPDEKHFIENLVPKLDMTSQLISSLQAIN